MYFDGYAIKIIYGNTVRKDRFEFYYGCEGYPDGPGHGHVVSNDRENIHYWRLPSSEGGYVKINDLVKDGNCLLSDHGL